MISQFKLTYITVSIIFFSILFFSEKSDEQKNELTSFENENILTDQITPYCNGVDFNQYEKQKFSDVVNMSVEINDSNAWYINLIKSGISGEFFIEDKYKTKFNSIVTVTFKDFTCSFKADIRIHGDWMDHLDLKNLVSSMDVKLKEGNILGITKFKLFLPTTREYDNEIFITALLEELGFISPRSAYVNVNINSYYEGIFIFQEKASKEMIEYFNYREGPIIEVNERYWWNTDSGEPTSEKNSEVMIFGRVQNEYWAKRSEQNLFISLKALEKFNKSMFYSYDFDRQMNYEILNTNQERIYAFDAALLATRSIHAMTNHNRIFYYDNISENFEPIYYDGFSTFLDKEASVPTAFNYQISQGLIDSAKRMLQEVELNASDFQHLLFDKNLTMPVEEVKLNLDKFKNNLETITTKKPSEVNYINYIENIDKIWIQESAEFDFYDPLNEIYLNCNINQTFKCLNEELGGQDLIFERENTLGISLDSMKNPNYSYQTEEILKYSFGNNELTAINNPSVEIDEFNKTISVNFTKSNQKILVMGQNIQDYWNFNLNSNLDENQINIIQDFNSLTGCISFYESNMLLESITFENSFCEDSVNIIRSKGKINNIIIKTSHSDALDIDFSEIIINNLSIENAGNDCLDLSGGFYKIDSVITNNCGDKSVSVGENSTLYIDNLVSNNSTTAIAVKDSSYTSIKNLKGENNQTCFLLYRKKQEFGPSYLKVSNNECIVNSSYIQEGSIYEKD